jgi:hypothetical protein
MYVYVYMYIYVCIYVYMYVSKLCTCVCMYNKVLPEDGSARAETCKRGLIIIHVFYFICAFCWYIQDKIIVRKMHGM